MKKSAANNPHSVPSMAKPPMKSGKTSLSAADASKIRIKAGKCQ